MREIKFRAWMFPKSKNPEMAEEVEGIDFDYGKVYCKIKNGHLNPYFEDCILMQYTGLKDKNGKEIYEGDVVKVPASDYHKSFNAKIKFINGKFVVDSFLGGDLCNFNKAVEVIGNIYENSELIKE